MAKDILVNVQSKDIILSDNNSQTTYYEVVWGKLLDSDEFEYMNIVIPSGYVDNVVYSDNEYVCRIKASYCSENAPLIARFVVPHGNGYADIKDFSRNAPCESGCVYYPKFNERAEELSACQLPVINTDGHFVVKFKKFSSSAFSIAVIYSDDDTDFKIGNSDDQTAQLLSLCSPGSFYRYPTTGVDITKYINSVVTNTDLTYRIVSEFANDSKQVTEASFDSDTGALQVSFSGNTEAEDTNLTPVENIDVEIFRLANDDFIREACKSDMPTEPDNEGFMENVTSALCLWGLYDVGKEVEYDAEGGEILEGRLAQDGTVAAAISDKDFVVKKQIQANNIYVVVDADAPCTSLKGNHGTVMVLHDTDGKLLYVSDPAMYGDTYEEALQWRNMASWRCFIPLVDCTLTYYCREAPSYINKLGIFKAKNEDGNYASILGLKVNSVTGTVQAMVSKDSKIEDVKLDQITHQILVIQ